MQGFVKLPEHENLSGKDILKNVVDLLQEIGNFKVIVNTVIKNAIKSKVKCELTEKVGFLEKIVQELTVKLNKVEKELQDKKQENNPEEIN